MEQKILVVDDDASVRDLFQSAFHDSSYEIYVAENGEQAFHILKENKINLVFLDLKLFGMNGIELCREIKKKRPIAIIYAITGWTGLFEVAECREAGFDDYFNKPMQTDAIFKAVGDAFEKLERWQKRYPSG
jgi:DNA-binding response OmpR family regulator